MENNNLIIASTTVLLILISIKYYLNNKSNKVLDPKVFKKFPLIDKRQLSLNSALYKFGLPKSNDILGLPIGQHISIQAEIDGKHVMRSYTPTSSDDDKGHFGMFIKLFL